VAGLVRKTLQKKPRDGSTHWSVRQAAAETGISKSSVQRYFQLFGLNPHRTESFKLSTDAFFIEKLRDVVGLYLNPPVNVPPRLDVHLIVDNYSAHKHPRVKAWFARRPHWHIHFIPTCSSWLNQVERFFALITDKAIRRGSFTSVKLERLTSRISGTGH
jgi:hypothetical protein